MLVPVQESSLDIEIPYTFGKQALSLSKFKGQIQLDSLNNTLSSGEITVELEDFETKDPTLLCHFLESLTLDYSVSDYPAKHVCKDNKLPVTGKNSPQYRTITASLVKPTHISEPHLSLKWSIHGVEKDLELPVKMTWSMENQILNLSSDWKMKRSDFNIIVKKFLFVEADNVVRLKLNLKLGLVSGN